MKQPPPFPASELDRLFAFVLVNDVVDPAAALPPRMSLDHDADLLADVFRIAQQLWADGVDLDALSALVRQLGRAGDLDEADRLRFKHARAKLKLFRFACALRDRRHRYPRLLDHLTTALGHLQDAYKTGRRRRVRHKAWVTRLLLSRVMRRLMRWEGDRLRPDTPAGYRAFVSREVDRLRTMLARPTVTGAEFHAARKIISRQNAFYTAAATLHDRSEYRAMFLSLAAINGLMGALHDRLMERRAGSERDYHTTPFPLPGDIRRRLTAFVALHAQASMPVTVIPLQG